MIDNTGFGRGPTSLRPYDIEAFWQKENEASLIHLHGPVHMGFPHPLPPGAEIGELHWFDSRDDATRYPADAFSRKR